MSTYVFVRGAWHTGAEPAAAAAPERLARGILDAGRD